MASAKSVLRGDPVGGNGQEDGTRDPQSDFGDLRRQCEQLVVELSGGVDAQYWASPLKAIRDLLALVDDQAQQIASEKSAHARVEAIQQAIDAVIDGEPVNDFMMSHNEVRDVADLKLSFETANDHIGKLLADLDAARASLAAQAREIQELRTAITPSPFTAHKDFISLAIVHREDSEDVDRYEAAKYAAEAALLAVRPYLQHLKNCDIFSCSCGQRHSGTLVHIVMRGACTCGLAALDAPPEP